MSQLDQFRTTETAGAKAAFNKDTEEGTVVAGTITEVQVRQRTEYSDTPGVVGDPLFFPDGKPKMQMEITIDTGKTDPWLEDDNGLRRIYVKMDYKSDRENLIAAVDAAGDDDVQVGGSFTARYDGYGVDEQGRKARWKVYHYEYRKPSALSAAANGGQAGSPQPAPAKAPAPVTAPATANVAADQAAITAIRAMITSGVPDQVIATSFPNVPGTLIAALRNAA